MISYVYRISFPSGHYYIGVKKGTPEQTPDYTGSPKKNKWMWDEFSVVCKEILWVTDSFERALTLEKEVLDVIPYHSDPLCLNGCSGGRPLGVDHNGDKNPFFGKTHSLERRMSHSQLMSGNGNPFYGKKHTEETRKRMRECWVERRKKGVSEETRQRHKNAAKLWPARECPHCGVTGRGPNMTRYHFENCKNRD